MGRFTSSSDTLARLARSAWMVAGIALAFVIVFALEIVGLSRNGGLPTAPTRDRDLARRVAVAVTSFDYRTLDRDVRSVHDLGTPGFERDFARAMGPDFDRRVGAKSLVSVGRVAAGPTLQETTGGRASFIVLLDQSVTSEGNATPQTARVGLLVTVLEGAGKVVSVEIV